MPGGTPEQYARVQPILESVAAQLDGVPCVALMGSGSAGHYVKMVHNGIEYAVMQLLAEAYDLLGRGLRTTDPASVFGAWAESEVGGYLVEITAKVLQGHDEKGSIVDFISDKAKGKGTGKWTSQDAFDLGLPIPSIDAAVCAREVSGLKDQRVIIGADQTTGTPNLSTDDIRDAFAAASLLSYTQGLAQIAEASREYGYGTDLVQVARVWGAGCIIRSRLLAPIRQSLGRNDSNPNLLLDPSFRAEFLRYEPALRRVCAEATLAGIPVPCLSASLAYWDGLRSPRLPANLIQAQRDLFGAHTYERIDQPGTFHTDWDAVSAR
jgi:6-phosphogluconate dehydrogenase